MKLEKLEGSSFAYKSCHSESGFFLFAFCFSPKNFFFLISPRKCILHVSLLSSQCCFWATKRSVGGAAAMFLILSTLCSPCLVAGSSVRKKNQLVIQGLLQERTCISFCSFCRSADKRIERSSEKKKKRNSFALSSLNDGPEHLLRSQVTHKKSTQFSYDWE